MPDVESGRIGESPGGYFRPGEGVGAGEIDGILHKPERCFEPRRFSAPREKIGIKARDLVAIVEDKIPVLLPIDLNSQRQAAPNAAIKTRDIVVGELRRQPFRERDPGIEDRDQVIFVVCSNHALGDSSVRKAKIPVSPERLGDTRTRFDPAPPSLENVQELKMGTGLHLHPPELMMGAQPSRKFIRGLSFIGPRGAVSIDEIVGGLRKDEFDPEIEEIVRPCRIESGIQAESRLRDTGRGGGDHRVLVGKSLSGVTRKIEGGHKVHPVGNQAVRAHTEQLIAPSIAC